MIDFLTRLFRRSNAETVSQGPCDAPLSALISLCVRSPGPESMERFEEAFLLSSLGVRAVGVPQGATGRVSSDGTIGCGRLRAADGRIMLGTCADRAVFVERFGPGYNAEMDALSLIKTALSDPSCEGILVCSAESSHSIALTRETLLRLQQRAESTGASRLQ